MLCRLHLQQFLYNYHTFSNNYFIPVGQQADQAIEACVGDLGNAGCTSAYGLNSGRCKLFVLASNIGLKTV